MFSVKKVLKLFSFIVLITISVLIVYMGLFFGTIHIIASRNTVYAEKFNQKVFKAVAVGASAEEVKKVLGEPLEIADSPEHNVQYYSYSERKKSTHFYNRQIIFQDGKVVGKFSNLYFD